MKYTLMVQACIFSLCGSNVYAKAVVAPPQVQVILQSCDTPDNSNTVKTIEVYGVLDIDTMAISNLAVLSVVSSHVGDLKMIVQGGTVSGTPGSNVVYNNILGSDASLSINDNVGILKYEGNQTTFAQCR